MPDNSQALVEEPRTALQDRGKDESGEFLDVLFRFRSGAASFYELASAFLRSLGTYMVLGALLMAAQDAGWFGTGIFSEIIEDVSLWAIGIPVFIVLRRLSIVTTKLDALYRKEVDPEVRLRNALDELLVRKRRTQYAQDVAKHCEGLILAVSGLIGKDSWATDSYARFLSTLVWSVVGQNAQQLSELVQDDKGNKEFSVPPSAADLADKILEEQMKAMRPGDVYLVISDLGSWQMGQLNGFMRETENAVGRGVNVRRLFNLLHHDEDYPLPVDAGDILREHLEISQNLEKGNGGRYEIKLLGNEEYKALNKKRPAQRKLIRRDVVNAHFGVFRHGDEKMRFQVWRNNLSIMKLCRDPHEVGESLEFFECLWPDSAEITENLIRTIEERARRSPDSGLPPGG